MLHDAATRPRPVASRLLRGSAMVAVLGLLSIYGPSTASASSLAITTGGSMFTKTYLPCTTATRGVTYSGTANPFGGTKYPSIAITGLGGCEGLQLSYSAYGSSGQTLASGTNFTVLAGTNVVSPGGTYDAALVKSVLVTFNFGDSATYGAWMGSSPLRVWSRGQVVRGTLPAVVTGLPRRWVKSLAVRAARWRPRTAATRRSPSMR